jgi:hypothetical protein
LQNFIQTEEANTPTAAVLQPLPDQPWSATLQINPIRKKISYAVKSGNQGININGIF